MNVHVMSPLHPLKFDAGRPLPYHRPPPLEQVCVFRGNYLQDEPVRACLTHHMSEAAMFCNRLLTTMTVSVFVALAAAGCVCPSGGATTSSRSASGTLTPGELRIVDVETPGNTTQVNVRVSWVPGLAVWPVASSCPDQDVETCVTSTEKEPLPPPPAGVTKIGMMFEPVGAMLRVVIKNTTEDAVTFSVTVTPWRAGCT